MNLKKVHEFKKCMNLKKVHEFKKCVILKKVRDFEKKKYKIMTLTNEETVKQQ